MSKELRVKDDIIGLLRVLGSFGLNQEEIAEVFGVNAVDFSRQIILHPEFRDALEEGRENPNRNVENSLYRRALGYEYKEITKENGKPIKIVIKHMAPEVVACIFWLKNRDPKRWRDAIEMKFSLRDRIERVHNRLLDGNRRMISEGNSSEGS